MLNVIVNVNEYVQNQNLRLLLKIENTRLHHSWHEMQFD